MPKNYDALMQGLKLDHTENVVALNVAAWNKNYVLELFRSSVSGQHSVKENRDLGHIKVPGKKLDDVLKTLNIKRADWIKIDVEGAEWEVLDGLKNTLRKNSSKVIVEMGNTNLRKVFAFMKKLDYRLFYISNKAADFSYYYCEKGSSIKARNLQWA